MQASSSSKIQPFNTDDHGASSARTTAGRSKVEERETRSFAAMASLLLAIIDAVTDFLQAYSMLVGLDCAGRSTHGVDGEFLILGVVLMVISVFGFLMSLVAFFGKATCSRALWPRVCKLVIEDLLSMFIVIFMGHRYFGFSNLMLTSLFCSGGSILATVALEWRKGRQSDAEDADVTSRRNQPRSTTTNNRATGLVVTLVVQGKIPQNRLAVWRSGQTLLIESIYQSTVQYDSPYASYGGVPYKTTQSKHPLGWVEDGICWIGKDLDGQMTGGCVFQWWFNQTTLQTTQFYATNATELRCRATGNQIQDLLGSSNAYGDTYSAGSAGASIVSSAQQAIAEGYGTSWSGDCVVRAPSGHPSGYPCTNSTTPFLFTEAKGGEDGQMLLLEPRCASPPSASEDAQRFQSALTTSGSRLWMGTCSYAYSLF